MSKYGTLGLKKRRKAREFTRKKVLKMLAVMDAQQPNEDPLKSHSQEFLQSGRTGRRNALPDILKDNAVITTSCDLPERLEALTTNDGASTSALPSTSSSEIQKDTKQGSS